MSNMFSHEEIDELRDRLGTAESLVRELAQAITEARRLILGGQYGAISVFDAALSRIPARLRAPETTSTGESSQGGL